jgi:hypothetical protein
MQAVRAFPFASQNLMFLSLARFVPQSRRVKLELSDVQESDERFRDTLIDWSFACSSREQLPVILAPFFQLSFHAADLILHRAERERLHSAAFDHGQARRLENLA